VEFLGLEDGIIGFAIAKDDGKLVTDWGDVRVSSAQRSFALIQIMGKDPDRPQMIQFPEEAAWPAMTIPKGWTVAWVDRYGELVEVKTSEGSPLEPAKTTRVAILFAAPGGQPMAMALKPGKKLLWTRAIPATHMLTTVNGGGQP
jgi:hypothetical protein